MSGTAAGRDSASPALLAQDRLFVALTRPQLFAGVPYGFCIANAVLCVEAFLLLHSAWVAGAGLLAHGAAMVATLREPRFCELWLVRLRKCPRLPSYGFWRCNSYRA
ncbi:MAG TPA: VirB3 family type IV secretion system protein [Novosphingobium sp.]|nr:VirB3 family type IV secretion system protein [Novosphingobium sp.]